MFFTLAIREGGVEFVLPWRSENVLKLKGRNLYYLFSEIRICTTLKVGICTTFFQRSEFVLPSGSEFVLPFVRGPEFVLPLGSEFVLPFYRDCLVFTNPDSALIQILVLH